MMGKISRHGLYEAVSGLNELLKEVGAMLAWGQRCLPASPPGPFQESYLMWPPSLTLPGRIEIV